MMDRMPDQSHTAVRPGQFKPAETKGAKKNEATVIRQLPTADVAKSMPHLDQPDQQEEQEGGQLKEAKSSFAVGKPLNLFKKKPHPSSSEVEQDRGEASQVAEATAPVQQRPKPAPRSHAGLHHPAQPDIHGAQPMPRGMQPGHPATQSLHQGMRQMHVGQQPAATQSMYPMQPGPQSSLPLRAEPPQVAQTLPGTLMGQNGDPIVDSKGPGLVGLANLGNTCFMNSVLQCIGHIDGLANYFATGLYQQNLLLGTVDKKGRPVQHEFSSELTEALAQLLQAIWSPTYAYDIAVSETFKNVCAKLNSDYQGVEQQDALEFLLFLLHGVHDELNMHKRLKPKQRAMMPLEGASFVEDHAAKNRSLIYQLFYSYQRNSVTCPACSYTNTNIEPLLCLSLPIPVGNTRTLTVIFSDQRGRQMRHGMEVSGSLAVRELREDLANRFNVAEARNLILCEIGPNGFRKTYRNSESVSAMMELSEQASLYAINLPDPVMDYDTDSDSSDEGPVFQGGMKGGVVQEEDLSYIRIVSVHCERSKGGELRRFSGPLHTQLQVQCSYTELKEAMLAELEAAGDLPRMRNKEDIYVELSLADGPPNASLIQPKARSPPLVGFAIDRALNFNLSDGGARHLKISVIWGAAERTRYAKDYEDEVEVDPSVQASSSTQSGQPITLRDCLEEYMKSSSDATWLCPHCRRMQQAQQATRFYICPDVLVVQLKRFQKSGNRKSKISHLVQFPVESLDLNEYVDPENSNYLNPNALSAIGRQFNCVTTADYTYDLIGVVNHIGSLQTGHYTSYVLHPADRQWWQFSDSKVEELADLTQVISSDAYLLFYQRRTLRNIFINNCHWSMAIGMEPQRMEEITEVALRSRQQRQGTMMMSTQPITIDETAVGRTVNTGRARIHVPDTKKRQGKWVWRGGVKVWDGPDPPPSE